MKRPATEGTAAIDEVCIDITDVPGVHNSHYHDVARLTRRPGGGVHRELGIASSGTWRRVVRTVVLDGGAG